MRKWITVLLIGIMLGTLAVPVAAGDSVATTTELADCEFPISMEDATGTEVTLDEPPERIVTTSPSAAQTVWEIGAEDRVVGTTEFAHYLEGAEDRTVVLDAEGNLIIEEVVDLEPDLVLAPNTTSTEEISQLRDADLTVYHFGEEETIDDIFEHTAIVGSLTGECDGAADTIEWMEEELSIVEEAVEGKTHPGAMYLFFDFTAGANTFINEIIETAGAENLAASAGIEGFEPISEEVVLAEDPEWIILNSEDPALPESDVLEETTAAQEDQFVEVQVEHLNQPAPRTILAILTLTEAFHPDAYEAAVEAQEADDTEDADADDAMQDDEDVQEVTDDADDDAIPGFGPIVALIGMGIGMTSLRFQRSR